MHLLLCSCVGKLCILWEGVLKFLRQKKSGLTFNNLRCALSVDSPPGRNVQIWKWILSQYLIFFFSDTLLVKRIALVCCPHTLLTSVVPQADSFFVFGQVGSSPGTQVRLKQKFDPRLNVKMNWLKLLLPCAWKNLLHEWHSLDCQINY